jgi:Na+/alanine symporter
MADIPEVCFQHRVMAHLLIFRACYVIVFFLLRFSAILKCYNYIDNEINYLGRNYYIYPWRNVLIYKLIVVHLVEKIHAFYGT